MPEPMNQPEKEILLCLNEVVSSPNVRAALKPVISRVRQRLATTTEVMAWEPIPVTTFAAVLPGNVQSAWIFILRAGVNTGAERHPNSRQRMMSLMGAGDMQTRNAMDTPWQSNILSSDPAKPLEQRWISIPPNVWHQPVTPPGEDWVVVSFHTVAAEELIEERPDPSGAAGTKQKRYITAASP